MGIWTESVETKAAIIHMQMAAARSLAMAHGGSVDEVSKPYLSLLNSLYQDEFAFAQLVDSSDLVARFKGPSVDIYDPTVSTVISIFSDIREQVRGIAKSIVGLSSDRRVKWPAELDPQMSGVAHGSLVVGIRVPSPTPTIVGGQQLELEGVSAQVFESVRGAIRSLSVVARYIHENQVDDAIREEFPDPAVRDTVLVAARKLAPTGRRGIDSVSFYSPNVEEQSPALLTPLSRVALSHSLARPVKVKGSGEFEGVVREVDLDARRFEIRHVKGIGAIRCVYQGTLHPLVKSALDARVRVIGDYETLASEQPRLVAVQTIKIVRTAQEQLSLPDEQ